MNEIAMAVVTGLLIPAVLWFFRDGRSGRIEALVRMAEAHEQVKDQGGDIAEIIQAEIDDEKKRRLKSHRFGTLGVYVAVGLALATIVLHGQLWYLRTFYKAEDEAAQVLGNPDIGIATATSVFIALTVVGLRNVMSRGPAVPAVPEVATAAGNSQGVGHAVSKPRGSMPSKTSATARSTSGDNRE